MKNTGQLLCPRQLGLARAVGEEDVRDFDAKLVVAVQDIKHLLAFGDQPVTVDQDTVDVKDKRHILGCPDLLGVGILYPRGQKLSCGVVR